MKLKSIKTKDISLGNVYLLASLKWRQYIIPN